jgi:hypothetical protein
MSVRRPSSWVTIQTGGDSRRESLVTQVYAHPGLAPRLTRNWALARSLLRQLFRRYPGSSAIRLWNGDKFSVGAAFPPSSTEAPFVLVFLPRRP